MPNIFCNSAIEGATKDGNRGGEELEADEAGEIVHQGAAATALPNSEAGEDRGRVYTRSCTYIYIEILN